MATGHPASARDFCVVYKGRVAVRSRRSLESRLVGTQKQGDVLQVDAVYGHWVRLDRAECARLKVSQAWMLTDGREQGFGKLLEPISAKEAAANKEPASVSDWVVTVGVEEEFEECIEIHWSLEPAILRVDKKAPPVLEDVIIEMSFDHSQPGTEVPTRPHKDAPIKRVPCEQGTDHVQLCMPCGRRFLVRVKGSLANQGEVRSAWIQAKTLSDRTRPKGSKNLDPVGKSRLACLACSCTGYIMTQWSANSRSRGRCRRCGCDFENHEVGSVAQLSVVAFEEIVRKFRQENPNQQIPPPPDEAQFWVRQEVELWLQTEGAFNPRRTMGMHRMVKPEGHSRHAASQGRISIISPTTESRQSFHSSLWACFEAQTWSDKELVVVETFTTSPSPFLADRAKKDPRLIYVAFQRPAGNDWTIGLKRNICAQLASGEFLAHFDDDDLYAPAYLSTLMEAFSEPRVQGVKLASWFIFDKVRGVFAHCDPVDCGKAQGKDETDVWVRKWLFGYGFSYIYRREAVMETPYRDLNLGEDYEFFSGLQVSKGNGSIVLMPDDAGICLHLQHGLNTSDTQHLADHIPAPDEVLDLEVADLHPAFDEYRRRLPKKRAAAQAKHVTRRLRNVLVRSNGGGVVVECPKGATAAEFIHFLEQKCGVIPVRAELYWVPPPEEVSEPERLSLVAKVLQLPDSQAACVQQARSHADLDPELAPRVRKLLEPIAWHERIGAATRELWLRLPSVGLDGRSSEYVRVHLAQEQLDPRSQGRTFHVQLALGSSVADLRKVLQLDAQTKILVLKLQDGDGCASWVPLNDAELVPEKVTISDFSAPVTATMILRFGQCLEVYAMMLKMAQKKETQAVLDQLEADANGDEKVYNAMLCQYLCEERYPVVAPHFGLSEPHEFLQIFVAAVTAHMDSDWELTMHNAWFEMESALRNRYQMHAARRWMQAGGKWNV